jgi:hypothetical protein
MHIEYIYDLYMLIYKRTVFPSKRIPNDDMKLSRTWTTLSYYFDPAPGAIRRTRTADCCSRSIVAGDLKLRFAPGDLMVVA